jgi:3-oxoadipate enol-lactonase
MSLGSGGSELFFTSLGAGPNLLLLHPTPVDHRFWMPVAFHLKDRYRLTLPDLRGHGQSPAAAGVASMELLADDIVRLLDQLGIESAFFAGCSIGGYVLYELWRRVPHRIQALAFCCGKPQPDAEPNRSKRKETIRTILQNGTADFFDQTLQSLVTPTYRQREPERTAELRAMMDGMTSQTAIAIQQGLMERPDSVRTVKTISAPVLALAATEDQASTPAEMKVIQEVLPSSQYHLLPGTGHYAPYEEPGTVAQLLADFFGSVSI